MTASRWVQVECGLPISKLIYRARQEFGIGKAEAVGLYVNLWLAIMELRLRGDIADRPDMWIEEAAGWTGTPGAFAAHVRKYHLDQSGVVKEWLDKYGKLDVTREKMARTKREQRARPVDGPEDRPVDADVDITNLSDRSSECPPDSPMDVHRTPSSISLSSVSWSKALNQDQEQENSTGREADADLRSVILARFGSHAAPVIALVQSSLKQPAVVATILAHLDGMHGPAYSPEVVSLAAQEYQAGVTDEGRFKPRYFAGFVERAQRAIEQGSSRKQARNERQFLRDENAEAENAAREEAEIRELLSDFERQHAEQYETFRGMSEKQVDPRWKGMVRGPMVRAILVKLIRDFLKTRGGDNGAA